MSTSQPRRHSEAPTSDSLDTTLIIVDCRQDPPLPPRKLSEQERLERRRIVDSYAVEPEKIERVHQAAFLLGRSKAELIREGLDLVLEKYRDKLADLANLETPSDAPKPQDGSPSP